MKLWFVTWLVLMLAAIGVGVWILAYTREKYPPTIKRTALSRALFIVAIFWVARIFAGQAWTASGATKNVSYDNMRFIVYVVTPSVNFVILIATILLGFSFALVYYTISRIEGAKWSEIGWSRHSLAKNITVGVFVGSLFSSLLVLGGVKVPSLSVFILATILSFLIASWEEENIFRGYLLSSLSKFKSKRKANFIQGLLFSIAHFGFYIPGYNYDITFFLFLIAWALTMGIVFGYLRQKLNSIIAPFIAHGLYDVVAFVFIKI